LLATRGPREDEEGIIPPAMQADPLRTHNKLINLRKDANKQLQSCHKKKECKGHGFTEATFFFSLITHTHTGFFKYMVSGLKFCPQFFARGQSKQSRPALKTPPFNKSHLSLWHCPMT